MKMKSFIKILIIAFSAFLLASCGSSSSGSGGDRDVDYTPDTFTVRFNLNGGVIGALGNTSDVVIPEIQPNALLGSLSRKPVPYTFDLNYAFVGWNTARDATGEYWTDKTPIAENIVLYAIYGEDITSDPTLIECGDEAKIYAITSELTVSSPICAGEGEAFSGRFYGKGNTIAVSGSGMFGKISGAYITDAAFTGSAVSPSAAGLVAGTAEASVIEKISVAGTIGSSADNASVGGVVGVLSEDSEIRSVVSSVIFSLSGGNTAAGGIAGLVTSGSIVSDSYHKGTITISGATQGQKIGAIAGIINGGTVSASYSDSIIRASASDSGSVVGGIAGLVEDGSIEDSAAFGIMITGAQTGRIAGSVPSEDSVVNSYAKNDMLLNYKVVSDSAANGIGRALSNVRKSQTFFRNLLEWDFTNAWQMPRHYAYPVPDWVTPEAFTEISTPQELMAMGTEGNYLLVTDIDMSGHEWTSVSSFSGVFDGNYKTISNFTTDSAGVGFIKALSGVVRDVTFENVSIIPAKGEYGGDGGGMGVVAASAAAGSLIDGVVAAGTLDSGRYMGGLVGQASGIITNSSFSGTVKCDYSWSAPFVGGLAGIMNNGSFVLFSSASGDVEYARYHVTKEAIVNIGGLAGQITGGTIAYSYTTSDVDVVSYTPNAGGLVGNMASASSIIDSYASGNVSAGSSTDFGSSAIVNTGGLAGVAGNNNTISTSAAFGDTLTTSFSATSGITTKTANMGKLYGKKVSTSNVVTLDRAYVNNAMNLTSDSDVTFTEYVAQYNDVSQIPTSVPVMQGFYTDTLGWNFADIWKMPSDGRSYPILQWQD